MSLRTGRPVATVQSAIINPTSLKIEGFFCHDSIQHRQVLVLLQQDIRDIVPQGLVIDDHDVLAEPEDLVRLKNLLDQPFTLMGKPVESKTGKRIGKVEDFATETSSMIIMKLYLNQSFLKSFSGASLSVDRNQIIEITDKKIIIKDPLQPVKTFGTTARLAPQQVS